MYTTFESIQTNGTAKKVIALNIKNMLVTYATNRNEQVHQLQWQLAELMYTVLSIIWETLSKNEYVTKKYMAL